MPYRRKSGLTSAQGNAAFERVFGVVGTTRAAIQTALDAAHAASGGHVYAPDGTYSHDGTPLTIYSNTWLELSHGAVVDASGVTRAAPLIRNAANGTTGRSITDLSVTSGSATISCVSAPNNPPAGNAYPASSLFQAADVGKTIIVRDVSNALVFSNASDFTTTIDAVAGDGRSATLHDTAPFTYSAASPAFGFVGVLDDNIKVSGGTWISGPCSVDSYLTHALSFSGLTGFTARDINVKWAAQYTYGGGYSLSVGNVGDFDIENVKVTTGASDGVHVDGYAFHGSILGVHGTCRDDGVGICAINGLSFRQSVGPVRYVNVDNVFIDSQTSTTSLWTAGDWGNSIADDITITRARGNRAGPATGTALKGTVLTCATGETHKLGVGKVTLKSCTGRVVVGTSGNTASSGGTVDRLRVEDHRIHSDEIISSLGVVRFLGANTTDTCEIYGITGAYSAAVASHVVHVLETHTINDLLVDGAKVDTSGTAGGSLVVAQGSGGVAHIKRLHVANSEHLNTGQWLVEAYNSGDLIDSIQLSNIYGDLYGLVFFGGSQAAVINMTNVRKTSGSYGIYRTADGATTVRGSGLDISGVNQLTASCHVIASELPVDVALIAKGAGDLAYNSNTATAPGVGLVACDGTSWKLVGVDRWHVFQSGMATPVAAVGTWAKNADNTAWFGGFQYNTTAAQNDAATFISDLSAGTWTLDFFSKTNVGYAIATIEFSTDGGSTWTSIGTKDLWVASGGAATTGTFAGVVIPKTGAVRVRFKAATRNASATSWFLPISAIEWTRTA